MFHLRLVLTAILTIRFLSEFLSIRPSTKNFNFFNNSTLLIKFYQIIWSAYIFKEFKKNISYSFYISNESLAKKIFFYYVCNQKKKFIFEI